PLDRRPVHAHLAHRQHGEYVAALRASGWTIREVPPAEDRPDSVFVEDTVVIFDQLAVITRPGAIERRPEVDAVEPVVRDLGLTVAHIEAPGTLDGGDVLQVDSTGYVCVGRGGRTNADGVRQLRRVLADSGQDRRVVPVPLGPVLHLKAAATALPDGTVLAFPGLVETGLFPEVRLAEGG